MVNATVDNQAVSIQLDKAQSTTVPTGEIWKVNISVCSNGDNGSTKIGKVKINGVSVLEMTTGSSLGSDSPTMSCVLVSGDTVSTESSSNGTANISGFVIN